MKKVILALLLTICASASETVIHAFLVGPGQVGGALLKQIEEHFSSDNAIEIRIVGLANSHSMLFDSNGIPLQNWQSLLTQTGEPMSLDRFIDQMAHLQLEHPVFVDCTSNQSVADTYSAILQSGIPIATPNKKANSGPYSIYSALVNTDTPYLYDATVGAGLPIIQKIQSMQRANDTVVKIEAILSGTLSYLFNTYDGTVPFSQVVREAQQKGYTEPDPRDDLNGMDMARKFLILARESGHSLELSDIDLQLFLPKACFEAPSVAAFYQELARYDETLAQIASKAKKEGKVLRFIGTFENGRASLALKAVGPDHPFFQLSDTDNIASISSRIYCKNPVVIKGPGAGLNITASNVLSNLIQAALTKH